MSGRTKTKVSATARALQRSEGELRLEFRRRGPASVLGGLYQSGCLKARLPRGRGTAPEAVCINTSGGLTDGDRLCTTVTCHTGAAAIVSGQAAERIYRSRGDKARIESTLVLEAESMLAWLPQEMIVFDGGRVSRQLDVRMSASAHLLAVEASILGRTAMGEVVVSGSLDERWHVDIDGEPVYIDALCLEGDDLASFRQRDAILRGALAFATVLFAGNDAARIRDAVGRMGSIVDVEIGTSLIGPVLVTRMAAASGLGLRTALIRIISTISGQYDDLHLPKVWTL